MENNTLGFSIANNSVTHLGRNLYSSNPQALAELVANSYDAYATEVKIDTDSTGKQLIISDNGKGLSFEEFEKKYVTIGKAKQVEVVPFGMEKRSPMGKKGIGKLASFSLGEKYSVYSKTLDAEKWISFELVYSEMLNSDSLYSVNVSRLDKLPDLLTDYETKNGFIIVVENLRRKITQSSLKGLCEQLSRRFYISQNDFNIFLNGEEVSLKINSYYNNLQFLMYFGYSYDEIEEIFDNTNIEKKKYIDEEVGEYLSDNLIKGWIGSVSKPKQLSKGMNNIIVYSNNKISDEDILKSSSNARIANNYIVGEVQADFISELEDPITSSRQGLDDTIPEVIEFIKNIEKIRNEFIEEWDKFRKRNAVNSLPERIKNNETYTKWLEGLTKKQKEMNSRLVDLFASKIDDSENLDIEEINSMVSSIALVINNVETTELSKALSTEKGETESVELLLKLMSKIATKEDLTHVEVIKSRIKVISKLEELMGDSSTLEKVFEEHLSKHPWLINAYWNIDRNKGDKLINQLYKNIKKENGEFERAFLDIVIEVAEEEYPVIVELKKNNPTGHANVTAGKMMDQIEKYRKAIIQSYPELKDIDEEEIQAYFIITENAGITGSGNKIEFSKSNMNMFKNSNIKVLKYNEIVENSKRLYFEHLKILKSENIIPDFSDEI